MEIIIVRGIAPTANSKIVRSARSPIPAKTTIARAAPMAYGNTKEGCKWRQWRTAREPLAASWVTPWSTIASSVGRSTP